MSDEFMSLWHLTSEDANYMSQSMLGRDLTEDELYDVKKGCEWGFGECRDDILKAAIEEAVERNATS